MSAVDMQGMIAQMQALAGQAGRHTDNAVPTGTGGFGEVLMASLNRINHLQQSAGAQARAFQAGEPGIALYDVMLDAEKAGLAFEMGVQMRNRLVNAYKEVMNMPV